MRRLDPSSLRWGPWLDGREAGDPARRTEPLVAPGDGRHLADVEQATLDDVAHAVASAHAAFAAHRTAPAHERARWLRDAAAALAAEAGALVDTLVRVLGKPRRFSEVEVRRGPDLLLRSAEELGRFTGETLPLDAVPGGEGRWGLTRREPFGVVAAITPFNAPVNLLLQKVAPALAVGNAVVVKPAPEASVVALQLAEILATALPPQLVSVLPGGPDVAAALAAHPDVRAVTLTGGVAAGEAVLRVAGVKPVLLELGSNAPNVVCADADVADAATRIAGAAFGASGQQCISAQRVIVEEPVFEDFLAHFVEAARALVVGDPDDPATEIGPMINERGRDRVHRHLADAEARGGKIVLDGRNGDSLSIGPCVVRDVPSDALLLREEVFGPVAVLLPAASVDDAIALANASDFGLQASCFTRDLATAMRAAEEIRAGAVWINEATRFRLDTYPFGGYGRSGIGREGVRYAMEALSQIKFVGLRGL